MILTTLLRGVLPIVFVFIAMLSPGVMAMTLDSFLGQVLSGSEDLRAIEQDIQALDLEISARDLVLAPTMSVGLQKFWDDRPSSSSNRKLSGQSTEILLSQPVATGTRLDASSYLETADYLSTDDEQSLLNWQLGVSQSLWQDAFGRQTVLRRERDWNEQQGRMLALLLQRQEVLVLFEELYWDIAYTRQEVVIRQENLDRSRRILSWIEERFNRSAAERVDILQAQALVSGRELQLQLALDNLRASQARLKEQLSFSGDLVAEDMDPENERPLVSLAARADFAPQHPVLIRSLQSRSEAGLLKTKARLASDQLKPRLELGYSYGQQGYHPSLSGARDQAFSRHNDYHQIGIVFSVPLGRSLIRKARESADIAASSGEIRAQKLERQSAIQWSELERTVDEQKQRLGIARELSRLQHDKSREERSRFEKGRSTAFQAITFEQDAAESQLLVLEQLRQLRQTEARARIFVMRGSVAP